MKKRLTSLLLCGVIVTGAAPAALADDLTQELQISEETTAEESTVETFADSTKEIDTGTCGDNAAWSMYSDGTLRISGTGAISSSPATAYKQSVHAVIIESGITAINDNVFKGYKNLASVELPDGLTTIGSSAFRNCTSLKSIKMPDSVTELGERAFDSCSSLTEVTISNGIKTIKTETFQYTGLKSLVIPNSVTKLEENAFFGCHDMASLSISNGLKTIGKGAFAGCRALKTVSIPKSVTKLEKSAFGGCIKLKSVKLHNGLKTIGIYAFGSCHKLQSINIPSSVTCISHGAFQQCDKLKTVSYAGTRAKWAYLDRFSVDGVHDYNFKVKCKDGTVVYMSKKLSTPKLVSATVVGGNKVSLKWNKVSSADGYWIYGSSNSSLTGNFATDKTRFVVKNGSSVSATVTSAKAVKAFKTKGRYEIKLRAYKTVGSTTYYSCFSEPISVK